MKIHVDLHKLNKGTMTDSQCANLARTDSPPREFRLASCPQELGLPRTGGRENGSSAIGIAAYFIAPPSQPVSIKL